MEWYSYSTFCFGFEYEYEYEYREAEYEYDRTTQPCGFAGMVAGIAAIFRLRNRSKASDSNVHTSPTATAAQTPISVD